MKYGLKDDVIEKIQKVLSGCWQIEKAVLYGSRAKGNYKNGSDIDLTLYGDKLSISLMNKISNELDDLMLPYRFDLSIFQDISNTDLTEQIKRIGMIFYER